MTEQLALNFESKRLVPKNYMHTLEHNVRDELTARHLGKENAIKADDLASIFNINTRALRKVIETIREKYYTKIVGDNNGYYIGSEDEFNEWYYGNRISRSMSSVKTTLDMNPDAIKLFYWLLNHYDKQGILKGQTQLQFNGWEKKVINQFKEDYLKERL